MRLAAIGLLLLAGCTVTDEQWDQFCPDGHCPIAKAGKAANAANEQAGLPYINPISPIGD